MLVGVTGKAFDNSAYIHELKLDGIRCVAYLGNGKTELRNRRLMNVTSKFPELWEIHEQVAGKVILDGELFVMRNGKPLFSEVQRRSLMSDRLKISVTSEHLPVTFTAFDILYKDGEPLVSLPLMERKEILQDIMIHENDCFSISRYIDTQGIALFKLTEQQGLEGIVSKRKDSIYRMGARTKDWIKCKNLLEENYVICGYIEKGGDVVSLVLGQYDDELMVYKGHVTLGVSRDVWTLIRSLPRKNTHPFELLPRGNDTAVWVNPKLICSVQYMEATSSGGMRQPVFKGLRDPGSQDI